jgi:DNA recombination protein RmuC
MRLTVDEKLQSTLETRLGEKFKTVSEQLAQVHRGLGEMQNLANDVGNLQRALSNVKVRGSWGEAQLGALLEDFLTPEQYEANVRVLPESSEQVEFAIKLPGQGSGHVWLPIDSKFRRRTMSVC